MYKADLKALNRVICLDNTDKNCIEFTDFLRKEVTGDEQNFASGAVIEGGGRTHYNTYFYKITPIRWNEAGLWFFNLWFEPEGGMGGSLMHSWAVEKLNNNREKLYMTYCVGKVDEKQHIIPYPYFQEMFQHVEYNTWISEVVSMVKHVNKHGFDADATCMYISLFGVREPIMSRKRLNLLWKFYPWANSD